MKRLSVAILIAFLGFGLEWLNVTPVHASALHNSRQSISPFFSQISDGKFFHQVQTSTDGSFQLNIEEGLSPGTHGFEVYFSGTQELDPAAVTLNANAQPNVTITMDGSQRVNLTDPIVLSGYVWDLSTNSGVANKVVSFSTNNGEFLGQTHTDDKGTFSVRLNEDLQASKYTVVASFKGGHNLSPASSSFAVEVLPATFKVQTVPAIGGITFKLDGIQFVSGQDGFASLKVAKPGEHHLEILLDQYHNPSIQVEFGRWREETYETHREVNVPDDEVVQVGLNVFHKVSFNFNDLDSLPVDPARIDEITIRSTQGDNFILKPGDTPWLPASRTARRLHNLEETDLLYSIISVMIDGSNVVNSAQQRFYAEPEDIWNISLLLYSLQVTSKDSLFAAPVGTSVNVIYPNGQIKNYPLDKYGGVQIHALARGLYRVSLVGVKGLGTGMPVALSRNQIINLKIVTELDIAVVAMIFIGFAFGLVFYGRPWLLNIFLRKKRVSSRKIRWTSTNEN